MAPELSRRDFLTALGAGAVTLACSSGPGTDVAPTSTLGSSSTTATPTTIPGTTAAPTTTAPTFAFETDPFRLGVASGDPTSESSILWTRLIGDDLHAEDIEVMVEVFADEALERQVGTMVTAATAALGHSVHIDATGLDPETWYWYRFSAGGFTSATGRTRTLPSPGTMPEQFRFAFSSCQNYEQGYYAAHRHLAAEDADLMVWLGDYIYEYGPGDDGVRVHDAPEIMTVEDYRARYALYKSDADLQASHAARAWICTWDDHEVDNDYAGATSEQFDDESTFLDRRAAGYQAWYEHMPVRLPPPDGPDYAIHRSVEIGDLVKFFVLDTRQYRSDQPTLPGLDVADFGVLDVVQPNGEEANSPDRTMLGPEQLAWLEAELPASTATWNVLAQQVFMYGAQIPLGDEPLIVVDTWDGYSADRARLLGVVAAPDVANPVVLTGDFHSAAVGDLRADPFDLTTPVVGTEFMASSISSDFFDGNATIELALNLALASNPQIRYFDARRGYCVCTVTNDELITDYRATTDGTDPDATISTIATFRVANGTPGAIQT